MSTIKEEPDVIEGKQQTSGEPLIAGMLACSTRVTLVALATMHPRLVVGRQTNITS